MDVMAIVIATAVVAVIGLIVGLGLGLFGEKFKVEVDEKEMAVREELPGNNCGGCGYAGCDALAKAIAAGEAPVNACPVGGAPVGENCRDYGRSGSGRREEGGICQVQRNLRQG